MRFVSILCASEFCVLVACVFAAECFIFLAQELRATVAELQVQVSTMQPEETAERPDMAAVSRVQPGASVIGTVGLMYWPQDGELIITVIKSDSHAFTSGVEVT